MILPTRRDWLFSAKTYMAAMLALYIALAFGLPRPYWAMTAVYVVANPISGATVSKALDRTLGPLLGATGTVILVPLLVNAPELLTFAIAAWAGTFLYIALHDRTPRNYVFLLAGYTLPLIALPSVGAPESIFDVAVARTEEITVGIVVTAAIGTTVFPVSVGSALNARITKWLSDAGAWTREILLAGGAEHFTPLARQQLAADISPLAALISQLAHDAGTRDVRRHAEELRGRLLFLLPILSSIADRLHALKLELKELPPDLQALTGCIAAWLKAPSETADPQIPDRLRAGLSDLKPPVGDPHLWPGLIRLSLVARLGELIDLWQDCLILQKQIRLGRASARWRPMLRHRPIVAREQHYDQGLMLFSVASTILATFTADLLWIWSGWSGGANAVAFVAIVFWWRGSARPFRACHAHLVLCHLCPDKHLCFCHPAVRQRLRAACIGARAAVPLDRRVHTAAGTVAHHSSAGDKSRRRSCTAGPLQRGFHILRGGRNCDRRRRSLRPDMDTGHETVRGRACRSTSHSGRLG